MAWKKTAHSSPHRGQHLQFLFEQRSEIHKNQNCEQSSAARTRFWQSRALVSSTKTLGTDLAPIGDEAPREDVEMGNDEDEEPLEAEVPRANTNPKNPTSREKQEHEDSGHAVHRNGCAACVEGLGVGGQHGVRRERERLRLLLVTTGS